MTAHPNAHILARLGELAQTTDRPWQKFEYKAASGEWLPVRCGDDFLTFIAEAGRLREYTPNPITINGKRLEGPLREAPEHKSIYWLLFAADFESDVMWYGDEEDREWLRDGRVFRTKEARDAVQAEIMKLLKGDAA